MHRGGGKGRGEGCALKIGWIASFWRVANREKEEKEEEGRESQDRRREGQEVQVYVFVGSAARDPLRRLVISCKVVL